MELFENNVTLRGTVSSAPQFSHENHGKRFFRFYLEVPRLSQTVDILPVIAQSHLLEALDPSEASCLTVTGQIRSHNLRLDGKRRLLIFVFASAIAAAEQEPDNQVTLEGVLCRDPVYRRTPLGREICDVMLAVPRAFQRSDYIPCILWGRTAQEISHCRTGDKLHILGRLQSRAYTKITEDGSFQKTAYEISALSAHRLLESCPEDEQL